MGSGKYSFIRNQGIRNPYSTLQQYIGHPGPKTYSNNFIGMSLCILLAFTAFQLIIVKNSQLYRAKTKSQLEDNQSGLTNLYWLLLIVFTSVSIAYSHFLHKTDCLILTSLMLVAQLSAYYYMVVLVDDKPTSLPTTTNTNPAASNKQHSKKSEDYLSLLRYFNRIWKAVHLAFTIAMAALFIILRLANKHSNP
jgi:hypothetical protein